MKSPAELSTTYPHARRHEQHAEDARDWRDRWSRNPSVTRWTPKRTKASRKPVLEAVDGRQRHGLTLLLAQTRRALGAGEALEGVEQVEQHGGELAAE